MFFGNQKIAHLYDLFRDSAITGINAADTRFTTKKDFNLHTKLQKADLPFAGLESLNMKCLNLMDRRAKYMVGEFDIHNEDYLLELWEPLIKAWYFGRVWVIKSEDVMELELGLAEELRIPEHKLYRGNPFRLFDQYTDSEGKILFKSLLTGIDNFDLDPKEMISLSNDDGQTFYMLWAINMNYLAGQVRVTEAFKACSKTISAIVRNKDSFQNESAQIENPSVIYKIYRQTGGTALEQTLYQEMKLIETVTVKDMLDINEEIAKKDLAFLGVVTNSTEKKERLTVAENLKDSRLMTNIQDSQLKNLKAFENKLKQKGWVKENCRIEIAGLSLTQEQSEQPQEFNPEQQPQENV